LHLIFSRQGVRGENQDKPWYIEEVKVSAKFNVLHYDQEGAHQNNNQLLRIEEELGDKAVFRGELRW
jgi:hypothetical protein